MSETSGKKRARYARTQPVARRGPEAVERDAMRWAVRIVASHDRDRLDRLVGIDDSGLPIGRAVDDDEGLGLDDPTLSRRHATIETLDGTLQIIDLGSANGVKINGVKTLRTVLVPGDVIRLGDTVMLVCRGERAVQPVGGDNGLAGRSPAIAKVRDALRRVAPSDLSVVVTGETGTGKEVVANALHVQSGRSGTFIAVNCPALPGTLVESTLFGHRKGAFTHATSDQPGAFVQADGGTLFLDEIGDMPVQLQPKLLRALESGEVTPVGSALGRRVDSRVVVATNVQLAQALEDGTFRQDLYARLAGVRIELVPLRNRKDDIPLLFSRFLPADLRHVPMSPDFAERVLLWRWPRNVRELRKLAERLAVLHADAELWTEDMLEPEMRVPRPAARLLAGGSDRPILAPEATAAGDGSDVDEPSRKGPPTKDELIELLDQFSGNVSKVARHVGRSRKQVYRWIAAHNLDKGTGR